MNSISAAKEFFERGPCLFFAGSVDGRRNILATDELKIFAIIRQMFVTNWVGSPIAALLCHSRIIAQTVETYLEV